MFVQCFHNIHNVVIMKTIRSLIELESLSKIIYAVEYDGYIWQYYENNSSSSEGSGALSLVESVIYRQWCHFANLSFLD